MRSFIAYSRLSTYSKQSSKLIFSQAKCCGSLIHQRSTRRCVRPQITTFNAAKLVPEDYFDLSSRIAPNIKISTAPTPLNPYYDVRNRAYLPYPPGTRGFYYFHSDPSLPAAVAQIRFRVTPSPDPASFSEGKDLLRPSSLPWSLQILGLASDPPKPILRELVKQGLVDTPLMEQCMTFYAKEPLSQYSHVATSLDDPFLVQFPVTVITFNTLGFGRMGKFILPFEKRNGLGIHDSKRTTLLSGRLTAKFVRSTEDPNILNIRVLKVVEPLTCPVPEYQDLLEVPADLEGSLLCRDVGSYFLPYRRRYAFTPQPYEIRINELIHAESKKYLRLLIPDPLTEEEEANL